MLTKAAHEIVWDNAEALTLATAAATAGTYVITAAQIATLEEDQVILVSVDSGDPVEVTLTADEGVVTKTTLAADIDALTGVTATVATNDVSVVSGTTGLASNITITTSPTTASVTIVDASHLGYGIGGFMPVWIDGVQDAELVELTGTSASDIADDLDAVDGITASDAAAVSTTVAIDITNTEAADGQLFGITIGSVVVSAVDITAPTTGAELATLLQTTLRAADSANTNISVGWSSDVLTITDTRGRAASGLTLTDSGGAVDATPTITNGSTATITITTVSTGSDASIRVPVSATSPLFLTGSGVDGSLIGTDEGSAAVLGSEGFWTGIYVGVAGDVKVDMKSSGTVTFKALPVGLHKIGVTRVYATGTTATNLLGLNF
jgi:hypothetical protein